MQFNSASPKANPLTFLGRGGGRKLRNGRAAALLPPCFDFQAFLENLRSRRPWHHSFLARRAHQDCPGCFSSFFFLSHNWLIRVDNNLVENVVPPLPAVDLDEPGLFEQEVVRRRPHEAAVAVVQELDVLTWGGGGAVRSRLSAQRLISLFR